MKSKRYTTSDERDFNEPVKRKKSLGALYRAEKTKPRSPDLTGPMTIQRHTLNALVKELGRTDGEVLCNIAAWGNIDKSGREYMTVELSPRFSSAERKTRRFDVFDLVADDDEE
jgi:hypothetical protein